MSHHPSSDAIQRHSRTQPARSWLLGVLIALVVMATAFRGGNRWAVLMVLEWTALLAMALMLWQTAQRHLTWEGLGTSGRRWAMLALVASPLWIALIQLLPWPHGGQWRPLSLTPDTTWGSALAALPCMALWLAAVGLPATAVRRLVYVWIAVAVAQAVLGLAQLSGQEALYFGMSIPQGSIGSFANRNHYASFLAMSIPLLLWATWFQWQRHRGQDMRRVWALGLALFLLFMALLASLSRAGQVLGMTAAMASAWMVWKPARLERSLQSWTWTLVPMLAAAALAVGGLEWLSRFDASQLASSAAERALNRDATLTGAREHLPFGAGLGSFAAVFPAYQPAHIPQLVDFAHNDYAQWLMEAGLLAVLVMLLFSTLVAARLQRLVQSRRTEALTQQKREDRHALDRRLVSACAISLGVVLLHAWVDFPLRIPANAMLASFVTGLFLRSNGSASPS